jgi:hypothetical protein
MPRLQAHHQEESNAERDFQSKETSHGLIILYSLLIILYFLLLEAFNRLGASIILDSVLCSLALATQATPTIRNQLVIKDQENRGLFYAFIN